MSSPSPAQQPGGRRLAALRTAFVDFSQRHHAREIMKGLALKERSDRQTAGHLAEWLGKLRQDFSDRILPISDCVAIEWAG